MKKRFYSFLIFILPLAITIAACTIKPPDDGDDLGAPASAADINAALAAAQAGYSIENSYRKGDSGTRQTIDKVLTQTSTRETMKYTILEKNPKAITYRWEHTDNIHGDVESGTDVICSAHPAPTPNPTPPTSSLDFRFFPSPLAKVMSFVYNGISKIFSSVTIEPTTAIGQTDGWQKSPTSVSSEISHSILPSTVDGKITGFFPHRASMKTMGDPGADLCDELAANPTPPPKPAMPSGTPRPSQYFGLNVFKHRFLTTNCAQIADCKVVATHIQFNEITKDKNGNDMRIHWIYEISIEVPGLFLVMEECYSTLITQGASQIPLTECSHVDEFKYGLAN